MLTDVNLYYSYYFSLEKNLQKSPNSQVSKWKRQSEYYLT